MKRIVVIKSHANIRNTCDVFTPQDMVNVGSQIVAETIKVLEKAKYHFSLASQNTKDDKAKQSLYLKKQRIVEQAINLLKGV